MTCDQQKKGTWFWHIPLNVISLCAVYALSALSVLAEPRVSCEAPEFDFGILDTGAVASHAFEIRNSGDGWLKLSVAAACCGAKVKLARSELGAGESTSATVKVALRNFSNTVDRVVFLGTSDKRMPYLKLRLKGQVIPPVTPPSTLPGASPSNRPTMVLKK